MLRSIDRFLLRQFSMTLPRKLEEAAIVDGASTAKVFRQIMLAIGVLSIQANWNNFEGALIYPNTLEKYPLVLGLQFFGASLSRGAAVEPDDDDVDRDGRTDPPALLPSRSATSSKKASPSAPSRGRAGDRRFDASGRSFRDRHSERSEKSPREALNTAGVAPRMPTTVAAWRKFWDGRPRGGKRRVGTSPARTEVLPHRHLQIRREGTPPRTARRGSGTPRTMTSGDNDPPT
jgi:hypothetical protein